MVKRPDPHALELRDLIAQATFEVCGHHGRYDAYGPEDAMTEGHLKMADAVLAAVGPTLSRDAHNADWWKDCCLKAEAQLGKLQQDHDRLRAQRKSSRLRKARQEKRRADENTAIVRAQRDEARRERDEAKATLADIERVSCAAVDFDQVGVLHVDPLEGGGEIEHFTPNGYPLHYWRQQPHECTDGCQPVYRAKLRVGEGA